MAADDLVPVFVWHCICLLHMCVLLSAGPFRTLPYSCMLLKVRHASLGFEKGT